MNGPELWCWWCCHPIEGDVLHLPKSYNETSRSFTVYGNFCSFECMKTFNSNESGSYKQNQTTLISKMAHDMCGKRADIVPAPPRECLKVFGGTMTIAEFRSSRKDIYVVYKPPLVSHMATAEIHATSNHRWINPEDESNKDKCFTLKEFEDSQKNKVTNVPMRIKPPVGKNPSKGNTLEMIMGLKTSSKCEPKSS